MAELASGAVGSLLGLLRNEALLLSRVGSDVEFIKEEMESMHSFLEHLARTAPPAGGHDEQVRTWMKQVQDLAHDCSNCVDLYLRLGDQAVFRARGGRWRYLWWASWLVQRTIAQHKAAIRLSELKERAREVGKRRLRYGVENPRKESVGSAAAPSMPSSSQAASAEDEEEEEEEDQNQAAVAADGSDPRQRALEPRVLEEYCAEKLANWLELQAKTKKDVSLASTAIVAPDDAENAGAIARDSLTSVTTQFKPIIWINLQEVHLPWDLPLLPSEILSYILRECEQQQSDASTSNGRMVEPDPRRQAYRYKQKLSYDIWNMINDRDINAKMGEIRKKIGEVDSNKVEETKSSNMMDKRLGILLCALRLMPKLTSSESEDAMKETVSRLKAHMEADKSMLQICLDDTQYQDILKKVFPASKTPQPQAQEATTSATATTLGEDHIKEIIHSHKITLDIILGLLPNTQLQEGTSAKEKDTDAASVMKEDKEKMKEISGEATNAAAASVVKETKEKAKEISEEVTMDIPAAVVKETKEKLKEMSTSVIKETKEKMEEISREVTSAIAADIIKEAKQKMKEISGGFEAASAVAAAIKETTEKTYQMRREIWRQLCIKGIVDKIKPHLKGKKTLIVLQDDEDYISQWEETRNALNLLNCAAGSAVIVSTKQSKKAKEFCDPKEEPITCSLVGFYHDKVLKLTQQWEKNPQILRDILDRCHPHEFCMKIFADALYANPKRSYEELQKLHEDLFPQTTLGGKAKKILKFSYKDLPREYKTCLLYLAIFPQGQNIRRSTLIGRWVTEGLITKQDWRTAVRHAERCFDALIKQGLVLPRDIGAAGKAKSCMVGDQVHGFITKIANKQHILDARLSDLWARHFSVFSGLRLRTSDSIDKFVHRLPKYSPQLPLLKVLDLEGVNCFEKNRYLKDICNKILLLKYLSLRRTNVSHLPSEINKLHELEVLDIRQTMVPEHATRHVLLLKLRRFMADSIDPRMNGKSLRYPVQIPWKIEKMENLEVLSNVRASGAGSELKDIRHLWQLRKLGVVIQDKNEHLYNLLRAISDLKECLQSLSVTISDTRTKRTPSSTDEQLNDMCSRLRQIPMHLESLTINGVTERVPLLDLLAKGSEELAEVTLRGALLKQENLIDVLAAIPKLCYLRLHCGACKDSKLTFKKEEFSHLKYFLVEGTSMTDRKESMTKTDIEFENGSTIELEKIVLSFTNIISLGGIDDLPELKELELEGNEFLHSFSQDGAAPEQNTESIALEPENTHSRAPEQNTESRATEHSTQGRAPVRNTESRAPEPNTERRATEQNTQSRALGQNTESRAPEENTESGATKKNTQSRAPEQNTESRATEQNTQSRAPEQNNVSRAPEQNTQKGAPEQNTQNTAHEQSTESRTPDQTIQSQTPKQNTESRAPEESRFTFKKEKFKHLKYFRVEHSKMTNITFETGAAPELKKIGLSLEDKRSKLTGVSDLPKLKEVELKGEKFLLSFFDNAQQIAKVTLHGTQLKQGDIQILSKKRNLRCLELSDKSYDECHLAFSKDEFPKLDLLIAECPSISSISFTSGSAPVLKKIVWSFTEMKSLSGINNLPKLTEIECIGDLVPRQVRKDITAHEGKPVLTHKKPQQQDQAKEKSTAEEDYDTRFPTISRILKIKNRR